MTNYRESMSQTLEYMAMIRERKILERELTDTELKRREEIAKDLPDAEFKDRYGDKWMEVKMATATKMAKKESVEREKSDLTEAGGLSPSMIKKLRKAYSTINKVDPTSPAGKKMTQLLDKMNKEQLIALVKADIKFISLLAVNRLIGMGMNASQIRKLKEDQEEFSEMLDRWEEETELLEKEVWDKPMPEKEKEGKLTPAQKAKAKARAAKAGRKYPNMIDNMWASNEEVEIDEKKKKKSVVFKGTPKQIKQQMKNLKKKDKLNIGEEEVEIDEKKDSYELYHKDFTSAMKHAYAHAKRMYGISIDPKEIDDKVATGPRKPGTGKTNKYRLKGDKGNIQIQVYNKGGSKPYELNMYKEEVELDEKVIVLAKGKGREVVNDNGEIKLMKGKKVISTGDYDSGAGVFFMNVKGKKGQVSFNEPEDILGIKEAYEIGTDEYRKYLETLTPMEGARGDAMRDMRRSGEFDQKDDDDVRATKDDRKAANKNILQQLKKTLDTKGKADIEFLDKKKKKVPYDIAVKAIKKYMGMRRSGDKLKFQQKIAKSYKDMLQALKENYEVPRTHKETILDRIDAKIQERKNG